jgi:hypothetical protein
MDGASSSVETLSIVKVDSRSYRTIAQENWGLTNEQMKGMHVHHRIPRSCGGTNDPSNLYVCSSWFHANVWHDRMFWVETTSLLHKEKDETGRSIHAVKTLGPFFTDVEHQKKAFQKLLEKNPNHQREAFQALLDKHPDHQSKAGTKVGLVQGQRNVESGHFEACKKLRFRCLVTGHVSNAGGLARWQKKRGIDTSLREPYVNERQTGNTDDWDQA